VKKLMFHRSNILSALWLACCSLAEVAQARTAQDVTVTFEPSIPLIEHRDGRQLLNFDLVVANRGGHWLRLTEIEISVFDSTGNLVMRKAVNSNGLAPGIEAVAHPQVDPGEIVDIFNPFYSLARHARNTQRKNLTEREQKTWRAWATAALSGGVSLGLRDP
jgi:hypothetical protein